MISPVYSTLKKEIAESPCYSRIWKILSLQESWCIYYSLIKGKSQHQIAEILSISQPTISYSLKRSLQRIKFINEFKWISKKESRSAIGPKFGEDCSNETFLFLNIGNQSEVARRIGKSQGYIRHRMLRSNSFLQKNYRGSNISRSLNQLIISPEGRSVLWPRPRKKDLDLLSVPNQSLFLV